MTLMLASVANLTEACLVAGEQVDFIDCKDPVRGALGALAPDTVREIIATLRSEGSASRFSATIGDLPLHPEPVIPAEQAMALTGVDYVKAGFFPGGDPDGVIDGLKPLMAAGTRLIAVLFGDDPLDLSLIPRLEAAGFSGVMLDTRDKQRGSLTRLVAMDTLAAFMAATAKTRLLTGLAGSLRPEDIPALRVLEPDYLGFRGALCRGGRTDSLDRERVRQLRQCLISPLPVPPSGRTP